MHKKVGVESKIESKKQKKMRLWGISESSSSLYFTKKIPTAKQFATKTNMHMVMIMIIIYYYLLNEILLFTEPDLRLAVKP